jgi:hypothetical protein
MEERFGQKKRLRWFNWRLDGATRGKESIIKWEGQGEGCGYSRHQRGIMHLCPLRTVPLWTQLSKY